MRLDLEHPPHLSWLKCSESEPIAKAGKKAVEMGAEHTDTFARSDPLERVTRGRSAMSLSPTFNQGARVCPLVFLHILTLVPAVLVN